MIRIIIDLDDHPSWAECSKEAVAERLTDLGGVTVVDVIPGDKPSQVVMEDFRPKGWQDACPHCGERVIRVMGPEAGAMVAREVRPRAVWPDPCGPVWVQNIEDRWIRARLEGDLKAAHTVGFPIHRCPKDKEVTR